MGVVAAYLCGSIPFGLLLARARGIDLRAVGSGNIGATNAARALGKGWGGLVLVLDAAKGALPVALARGPWRRSFAGVAAIAGHCFSPWLRFRGGKGVATALGVLLVVDPPATAAAAGVFGVVVGWRRQVSLASLVAASSLPVIQLVLRRPASSLALSASALGIIVWRHRANIERLRSGREARWGG